VTRSAGLCQMQFRRLTKKVVLRRYPVCALNSLPMQSSILPGKAFAAHKPHQRSGLRTGYRSRAAGACEIPWPRVCGGSARARTTGTRDSLHSGRMIPAADCAHPPLTTGPQSRATRFFASFCAGPRGAGAAHRFLRVQYLRPAPRPRARGNNFSVYFSRTHALCTLPVAVSSTPHLPPEQSLCRRDCM
jgi:hypothetical protein